jgi:phage-related protein
MPDSETQARSCIDTKSCILCTVKQVTFIGGSDGELRAFPTVARHRAGYQLYLVQMGDAPHDSKPMPSVGPGCREIRVRESSGAFRVFFVASVGKDVYVLHCFRKKTQQTPEAALALGKRRYQQMMGIVGGKGHK